MGSNAVACGYDSATGMVEAFAKGAPDQIEGGIRFIRANDLVRLLKAKNFAGFARLYNGKNYAQNRYDVEIAQAYKRWSTVSFKGDGSTTPPPVSMSPDQVLGVQKTLEHLGYAEVGKPDGIWGSKTTAAIAAFQHDNALPVTGKADDPTLKAFALASPRDLSSARTEATPADLRAQGSRIAIGAYAQKVKAAAIGVPTAVWGIGSAIPQAKGWVDQVKDTATDVPGYVWIIAIVGVAASLWLGGSKIEAARVEDTNTGKTA